MKQFVFENQLHIKNCQGNSLFRRAVRINTVRENEIYFTVYDLRICYATILAWRERSR